jgi:hypothetical protein
MNPNKERVRENVPPVVARPNIHTRPSTVSSAECAKPAPICARATWHLEGIQIMSHNDEMQTNMHVRKHFVLIFVAENSSKSSLAIDSNFALFCVRENE